MNAVVKNAKQTAYFKENKPEKYCKNTSFPCILGIACNSDPVFSKELSSEGEMKTVRGSEIKE